MDLVSESQVSPAGEWRQTGLVSGEYDVQIHRSTGELWKSESIAIADDDLTLAVEALAERITGEIRLGDRPLAESLSFGGEKGPTLKAAEDGTFAGEIPPGDEERVILVSADIPTVKRTIRTKLQRAESGEHRLVIDLPGTTLMGRVLNEDRSPDKGAIITISRNRPDVFEQTFSKADGSFQIAGFEQGNYRVMAEEFQQKSRPASVQVSADTPAEVELILVREVRVPGRMTMGEVPVIQARISALVRDGAPTMPETTTNDTGRFVLDLPPDTHTFDVLATHPAFDIVMGRATVQDKKMLSIRVQQIGGTLIVESPESSSTKDLLLLHDGAELWLMTVVGEAGGMVEPRRISVPRLQPGAYSVCLATNRKCVSGYVPPFGTLTLSLER